MLTGVVVEGSETEEGGRLTAVESAEFGHVRAEAGGIDRAETGDRLDDRGAAGEGGIGGDAGLHLAVALGDRGLHSLEGRRGSCGGFGIEFGTQLAEGGELLDKLAAQHEQVAEQLEVVRLGRGAFEALEEAEAGEHGGVDAIVLGELADGLSKASGAQRVDQHGLEAGVEEALVEVAVVAAGRFEDGAGDAEAEQPVAQGTAAGLGVVELAVETAVENVSVELGFADVDPGDDNRVGGSHSCVPILLRFGSVPTLPSRSRRNCCDGPTKLDHGSGNPRGSRSGPSPRWGLARPHRGLPALGQGGICYLPQRWPSPPAALGRESPR